MSALFDETKKKKIAENELDALLCNLEGKILTIVDSAISEKTQREATKSLVRQSIREIYSNCIDWMFSRSNREALPDGTIPFPYTRFTSTASTTD